MVPIRTDRVIPGQALKQDPATGLYLELVQLVSGLVLAGFLWLHMLLVASVFLGPEAFDGLALMLEEYYLAQIGIPMVAVFAVLHVNTALRRLPSPIQGFWRHAMLVRHPDTWSWVFQVLTAPLIALLTMVHVWTVLADWPIEAAKSAARVESFLWLYILLLVLGEYHAGVGIYRQFIKWGWFRRRTVGYALKVITLFIIILGLATLWVFLRIGGGL